MPLLLTVRRILLAAALAAVALLGSGCGPRPPIVIGYGGPLSGRNADLGNAGLDGVRLAVEECMASGGVGGSRVELLIGDDEMDGDIACRRDAAMLDRGIVALIGHMTSNASVAALPLFNQRGVLMLSPTTSTHELNGRADCFFRVYPDNHAIAGTLGRRVGESKNLRTAAVLYETSNASFTLSCKEAFEREYTKTGGRMVGAVSFKTGPTTRFAELVRSVMATNPACLYVLANAMDAAMVAQQVAKQGKQPLLVVADWSLTDDLLAHGGRAIEGLFAMHTVDRNSQAPRYLAFKRAFEARYARSPEFAAVHGYDSANVLLTALRRDPRQTELPRTLLAIRRFEGLQGLIEFDDNGDVLRQLYAVRVVGGRLVTEGATDGHGLRR
ncbi:MAG: ABC transporter substrate-binding protein [Armatimonadetes bacterium]|nr:ABC transporter substrate-binding protein [Armatimonadota bacterium]